MKDSLEHLALALVLWIDLATHHQPHLHLTLLPSPLGGDVHHRLGPYESTLEGDRYVAGIRERLREDEVYRRR